MTAESAMWCGQSIQRVQDAAPVTGRGRFTDDLGEKPGTLHAAILRSMSRPRAPRPSADRRHHIRIIFNGRPVEGEAAPRLLLTDFSRHGLGMTGTHVGCEHGVCGAGTVEIDGVAARACLTLAVQADGATIRTVEGLAPAPGRLTMLQGAFRRHQALQCGFCTPGILMSLDVYLRDPANPSKLEPREYLSGHLCRRTGYVPIVAAALDAAKTLERDDFFL